MVLTEKTMHYTRDIFHVKHALMLIVFVQIHKVWPKVTPNGFLFGNKEPTGCDYNSPQLTCDYTSWDPPISDSDLSNSNELHSVVVENVDGAIPTEAFSGLDGPSVRQGETFIEFDCSLQDIHLGISTFTSNLDWVESIYIKACYVQSGFPSNVFEHLSGVTKLEIAGGGIPGSIHTDSLAGLDSLTDLIMNSALPDNTLVSGFLSGIPNVKNINLKSSGLANISVDAFTGLYNIKVLDLSSNVITTLPEELLVTAVDLETLDMSENSLTSLPQGLFSSLTSLTNLDISGNSLTSLPAGILDTLVSLQTIDLSENSLDTLPDAMFDFAVALETIDVSRNSLDYLPGGLFNFLEQLQRLDLSENALTTLPENLFNPLISITSVALTDNRWDCSCGLYWVSTWSLYTGIENSIECSTPSMFNGTLLNRAMMALNCSSSNTVTYVAYTTTEPSSETSSATESTSTSADNSLTLWETVSIALSGSALLISLFTVLGTCVAYNKMTSALTEGSDAQTDSLQRSTGRKLFSRSTVRTLNNSEVRPYYDVHYNRKF